MAHNQSKQAMNDKGFNLVELMIVIFMNALILTAMVSIFTTSGTVFQSTKNISDVKEISKGGMAQLEWLFQRWATSTPCYNASPDQCTKVMDCKVGAAYPYPPPSTLCITIINDANSNPCDEAHFYANLAGNGFVQTPAISNPAIMNIKSCRLSLTRSQNCYHVKKGSQFLADKQNPAVYTPLVFELSDLQPPNNYLDCTDGTLTPNATISANITARNGQLSDGAGGLTTDYALEGGEVIFRVPHRIRLFCQPNSADQNRRWLYMEATDMASACTAHEPRQPLIPVNSFNIVTQSEGVVVTMQVRGPNGNIINTQRHFAR